MPEKLVRVWVMPDRSVQHLADPPGSATARDWEGSTLCGASGELRWVHYEMIDVARACPACTEAERFHPVLEGDYPGPP